VVDLLSIPQPGDAGARKHAEIMLLIDQALRRGEPLPSDEDIRRRVKTGQSIAQRITVGEFLTGWLAGRRNNTASYSFSAFGTSLQNTRALSKASYVGAPRNDLARIVHVC
jgi:hypothetical protein